MDLISNKQATINKADKICLFGFGSLITECFEQACLILGRKPDYFSDNAASKWGQIFFGIPCIPPAELAMMKHDIVVVISVRNYEVIREQLLSLGITNIFVLNFDRGFNRISDLRDLSFLDRLPSSKPRALSNLNGKWALVTGASRGIGFRIANALAEMGVNIIAHSRKQEHNTEIIKAIEKQGVQTLSIGVDLCNTTQLEECLEGLPDIDILINCAGISGACENMWRVNYKDYIDTYTVNTVAPIMISNFLLPRMMKRGYGRVVNVSSTIQHRPYEMAYACSKAALDKYVNDIVPSLDSTHVKICLVDPGWVKTDMGGELALHDVDSVLPGAILGVVMDDYKNGRWFSAQDYTGYDVNRAVVKAKSLELNSVC